MNNTLDPPDCFENTYDYYELTYLAIGSSYSDLGGPQQFPPFLKQLMATHPDWHLNLVLVDPEIEDPPRALALTQSYHPRITITCVRQLFSHQLLDDVAQFGKREVDYLIRRTLESHLPCLLLVHTFTGYSNETLSTTFRTTYSGDPLYSQRCLVDIGYGEETGCFFDMSLERFSPLLYTIQLPRKAPYLAVFDPRSLNNHEIMVFVYHSPNNPTMTRARDLVWGLLNRRLIAFETELSHYRYYRLSPGRAELHQRNSRLFVNGLEQAQVHLTFQSCLEELTFFEPDRQIIQTFLTYLTQSSFDPYSLIAEYRTMVDRLRNFFHSPHSPHLVMSSLSQCLEAQLPSSLAISYQ